MTLCNLMHQRGVTTHDLAELIDSTNDKVCMKIDGKVPWDLTEVVAICEHLDTIDISLFGVQFDSNT